VEIVVILVAGAGLSAAWAWWRLSRPNAPGTPRGRTTRLVGFADSPEEATSDSFVFAPSPAPPIPDDRPPPAMSIARLALAIALSAAAMVVVGWAIGFLIKLQLDRYFLAGG
jgi:hypothetical protein